MTVNEPDWTAHGGRSNSSPEFHAITAVIEDIIRSSAHTLISGRADTVAGTILATLAHRHGLRPGDAGTGEPYVSAVVADAVLPVVQAHVDGGAYELAIRIPMAAFTVAPNADPRLDRLVDLAMGLFPGADATGAPAWLEDGPPPCPTCGATDRAERRHRAHADAEAALRELVRWLTAERDRLDGYDRHADAYSLVLDRLRDQGLDVDYLAQPPAKETPDA